ncbi:MAG: hypothetical protein J7484_07465 [Microbacterium sp.]|nr:hypothetical protein [Microbacterium sp.]
MIRSQHVIKAAWIFTLGMLLVGCLPPTAQKGDEQKLNWEQAKARAQAGEMQIVSMVPSEFISTVEQKPTGLLFSCAEGQYRWKGATTVILTHDADIESIVKSIEQRYRDADEFDIDTWRNVSGWYDFQLKSRETAANYIVGQDNENTIRIDSGSVCFTLPEGVYPGGKF